MVTLMQALIRKPSVVMGTIMGGIDLAVRVVAETSAETSAVRLQPGMMVAEVVTAERALVDFEAETQHQAVLQLFLMEQIPPQELMVL